MFYVAQGVTDEHDCPVLGEPFAHDALRLLAELAISHGKRFVEQQDIGLQVDRRREAQTRAHARRVGADTALHRVSEARHPGNRLDTRRCLLARQPHQHAVHDDIPCAGQFAIEPRIQR